jgi:3-carboxy-cis,cis-muconate cycloisomerase
MMGLAPKLGRQPAHDEVYAACRDALATDGALIDALLARPKVAAALMRAELESICEPANYLGTAAAMVDRVLAHQKNA